MKPAGPKQGTKQWFTKCETCNSQEFVHFAYDEAWEACQAKWINFCTGCLFIRLGEYRLVSSPSKGRVCNWRGCAGVLDDLINRTWITCTSGMCFIEWQDGPCSPAKTSQDNPLRSNEGEKCFAQAALIPSMERSSSSYYTNSRGPTLVYFCRILLSSVSALWWPRAAIGILLYFQLFSVIWMLLVIAFCLFYFIHFILFLFLFHFILFQNNLKWQWKEIKTFCVKWN